MAIWLYHFQLLFYPFRLFFSGYLSHDYSKSSKAEGFSLHTFFLVLDNEQNLEKSLVVAVFEPRNSVISHLFKPLGLSHCPTIKARRSWTNTMLLNAFGPSYEPLSYFSIKFFLLVALTLNNMTCRLFEPLNLFENLEEAELSHQPFNCEATKVLVVRLRTRLVFN